MKGISPLIASVLLIAFTMSIALIAAPFFANIQSTSQEGVSEQQRDVLQTASAGLDIVDASYDKNSENLSVNVRNSGGIELTGFTVTVFGDNPVQEGFNRTLEEQEIGEFVLELGSFENKTRIRVSSQEYRVSASLDADEVATGSPPSQPTDISIS